MDSTHSDSTDEAPPPGTKIRWENELILKTIEVIDREIEAMRRIQQSRFREIAIAAALVTWGATVLPNTRGDAAAVGHGIAAFICVILGWYGAVLIGIYRARIHFLRERRNQIASSLPSPLGKPRSLFPPIEPSTTTSKTYCRALFLTTAALAVFNLVSAAFLVL